MIKQEQQIVRRTFTVMAIIALLVVMFGCNQDPAAQSCECFETYENLEQVTVNGQPSNQWVFDYNTPSQNIPCSNASDYVYMSNGTKRYKTTCN